MRQARPHRQVKTAAVLALAVGIVAVTGAAMRAPREGLTQVRTMYGELPLRLCIAADASIVAALARGEMRLLLQLRDLKALPKYSAPFSLYRVVGDQRGPLVETFGMQPDYVEEGRVQPQSFLFSVRDVDPGKVCFDLAQDRDRPNVPPRDAVLEVAIQWARQP